MISKGNNGTGNNENRDDWETPQELFDTLNKQYNFEFDCCATINNTKCESYCRDFLKQESIKQTAWMNPPFSKAKEMFKQFFEVVTKGVAIYRCDNLETKIWQEIILPNCDWIFIPKGRTAYEYRPHLRGGKGSRFPSALIGKEVQPPTEIEGTTLKVIKQ